jgi:hypothetical protein
VRLAREGRIERFEPLGRVKKQRCGLVAAAEVRKLTPPTPAAAPPGGEASNKAATRT